MKMNFKILFNANLNNLIFLVLQQHPDRIRKFGMSLMAQQAGSKKETKNGKKKEFLIK